MQDFYDQLSPFYHLVYQDWETSVERQGQQLSELIQKTWGGSVKSVLDIACGIGTQSLGLATHGFKVTASDLSEGAVTRARREAGDRNLAIDFSVADMRHIETHHGSGFDVVLCADNSIPHLLNDGEIRKTLRGMYSALRPGGGCMISLRDYGLEERGKGIVKPYGVRDVDGKRYVIWQVWDFEGDQYQVSMYFIEDELNDTVPKIHVMRSRYYAIPVERMMRLMCEAGFEQVERHDDAFFQPLLIGSKLER